MTTQHHDTADLEPTDADTGEAGQTDPVGPVTLPRRSRAGARAMALVGCPVGIAAGVLIAMGETQGGTFPTISVY